MWDENSKTWKFGIVDADDSITDDTSEFMVTAGIIKNSQYARPQDEVVATGSEKLSLIPLGAVFVGNSGQLWMKKDVVGY